MVYGPLLKGETYEFIDSEKNEFSLTMCKVLGRGGYGIVYLMKDINNVEHALKMVGAENDPADTEYQNFFNRSFHPGWMDKEKTLFTYLSMLKADNRLEDFQKEIKFLEENRGKYIMPIRQLELCINSNKIDCYLMPKVEKNLDERIPANSNIETALKLLLIFWKLAGVLVRFGEKRVIHQDIKPENILLESDWPEKEAWQPLLADFGTARKIEVTRTITLRGTPEYMSLEQQVGIDQLCDVYALGVILEKSQLSIKFKALIGDMKAPSSNRCTPECLKTKLGNIIQPLLKKYLDDIKEKNREELVWWLDFAWEFLHDKNLLDQYLKYPKTEVHYRCPNAKRNDIAGLRRVKELWNANKTNDGIVNIEHIETRGRNVYLLSEETILTKIPLESDEELLRFAVRVYEIIASLKNVEVKTLGSSNFVEAGGKIKLVLWRNELRYEKGATSTGKEATRILAGLYAQFWIGDKISSNWQGNDEFKEKKNGVIFLYGQDYLDDFTGILLNGMRGSFNNPEELLRALLDKVREARVKRFQKRYKDTVTRIKQVSLNKILSDILQTWGEVKEKEKFQPSNNIKNFFTGFHRLLHLSKDRPLENKDFSLSQCKEKVEEINKMLTDVNRVLSNKINAVKVDEITNGVDICENARKKIASLVEAQEIFSYLEPKENPFPDDIPIDFMVLSGELLRSLKVEDESYLLRFRVWQNFGEVTNTLGQAKNALSVLDRVLEKSESLGKYISPAPFPLSLGDLRQQGENVFFDWRNCPRGEASVGKLLNSLLYAGHLLPGALRFALLAEKKHGQLALTTKRVLQALCKEYPELKELQKYIGRDSFDGNCWEKDFLESRCMRLLGILLSDLASAIDNELCESEIVRLKRLSLFKE